TIATSVARYERGEITSTLAMLYGYLRTGMEMNDLQVCATVAAEADTTKASTDPFVVKRRQFRAALVSRCKAGGSAEALAAYQKLRMLFQAKLAMRFPFADSTQLARAGDADPGAVREFFKQYDAFMAIDAVALRSDPALAQLTKNASAFLDELTPVRSLLATYGEAPATPSFGLLVGP